MTIGNGLSGDSFGELYENGAGTDIVIATPGDFEKWTGSSVGDTAGANRVVGSAANDNLTIGKYGVGNYDVDYHASLKTEHNQCLVAALFKNDVKIAETESRMTSSQSPQLFADSIVLNAGALNSGSVANTRKYDGVFYDIQEVAGTPGFQYDITLTDAEKLADIFQFIGSYNVAATAHNIKAKVFNRNTTLWDDLTAETSDFPPLLSIQYVKRFKITGSLADYYNAAGEIIIRIDHISPGNTGHQFLADELSLIREFTATILSGAGSVSLVEGDVIDLRFTCPTNAKTITTTKVNLNIHRVG
jgi:hypothetical protein